MIYGTLIKVRVTKFEPGLFEDLYLVSCTDSVAPSLTVRIQASSYRPSSFLVDVSKSLEPVLG